MSEQNLRFHKVFESDNGRFLLLLLVSTSDINFENIQLTLSDGNCVWKAKTSFRDVCGTPSTCEENVRQLTKRIKNSHLNAADKDRPHLALLPPGRPLQLGFRKSNYDGLTGERLNMMICIVNSMEMHTSTGHEDTSPILPHQKPKAAKMQLKPKAGMSLLNPGSKKVSKGRGVDFD